MCTPRNAPTILAQPRCPYMGTSTDVCNIQRGTGHWEGHTCCAGMHGWMPTERSELTSTDTDRGGQTRTSMDTPVILLLNVTYIWTFRDAGRNAQTRRGILTDVFVQEVHLYTYMGTHHSCTRTQTHVDTQMCTTTHMYLINSCTDR